MCGYHAAKTAIADSTCYFAIGEVIFADRLIVPAWPSFNGSGNHAVSSRIRAAGTLISNCLRYSWSSIVCRRQVAIRLPRWQQFSAPALRQSHAPTAELALDNRPLQAVLKFGSV